MTTIQAIQVHQARVNPLLVVSMVSALLSVWAVELGILWILERLWIFSTTGLLSAIFGG